MDSGEDTVVSYHDGGSKKQGICSVLMFTRKKKLLSSLNTGVEKEIGPDKIYSSFLVNATLLLSSLLIASPDLYLSSNQPPTLLKLFAKSA